MITMQTIKLKAHPKGCVFFCSFKMDKMAESGQYPDLTLDEINNEIKMAREEIHRREKDSL